jgi:hypothetical protein
MEPYTAAQQRPVNSRRPDAGLKNCRRSSAIAGMMTKIGNLAGTRCVTGKKTGPSLGLAGTSGKMRIYAIAYNVQTDAAIVEAQRTPEVRHSSVPVYGCASSQAAACCSGGICPTATAVGCTEKISRKATTVA